MIQIWTLFMTYVDAKKNYAGFECALYLISTSLINTNLKKTHLENNNSKKKKNEEKNELLGGSNGGI